MKYFFLNLTQLFKNIGSRVDLNDYVFQPRKFLKDLKFFRHRSIKRDIASHVKCQHLELHQGSQIRGLNEGAVSIPH